MTSFTTLYDLPYPDEEDLVVQGDDAIEALAARLESILAPAYFDSLAYGNTAQSATPAGVTVELPGEQAALGEFTYAGGTLTYSGPPRPFTIAGGFSIHGQSGSSQVARLEVGGVIRAVSESSEFGETAGLAHWAPHALSWSGFLQGGTTIKMTALDGSSGAIWYPRLSVVSTGPRQS